MLLRKMTCEILNSFKVKILKKTKQKYVHKNHDNF